MGDNTSRTGAWQFPTYCHYFTLRQTTTSVLRGLQLWSLQPKDKIYSIEPERNSEITMSRPDLRGKGAIVTGGGSGKWVRERGRRRP